MGNGDFALPVHTACRLREKRRPHHRQSGTVDGVKWGAAVEELTSGLREGEYEVTEGDTVHVAASDSLYGCGVKLDYLFCQYGDSPVLEYIYIIPENYGDIDTISQKITEIFGEKETEGYTNSGETYTLTEENQYWHSEKSLEELLSGEARQKLLDEGYTSSKLASSYPVMITLTENLAGETCFEINGIFTVYLPEWQKQ